MDRAIGTIGAVLMVLLSGGAVWAADPMPGRAAMMEGGMMMGPGMMLVCAVFGLLLLVLLVLAILALFKYLRSGRRE